VSLADQSMGFGLRALGRLAGLDLVDRLGLRMPVEKLVYGASKGGFRAAGTANRAFTAATRLGRPARLKTTTSTGLFDLNPDDEQQMLRESFKDFARTQLRPAAQKADAACEAPPELLGQAAELGLTMLGVPEELGGAVSERSAVTSVLIAEALAWGDMGLAAAVLAPAGVATAISLWGDADQQAAYLPALVGDDPPAAALALLEPAPLFDPLEPQTTAAANGDDLVLTGTKSLVPLARRAELFVVGAAREDGTPVLVIVESGSDGVSVEAEPAMGVRAAATARLILDGVRVPASAVLGDPAAYVEAVQRARLAWCAAAVGTAQAVLDYVIPAVNERTAFGEPVSHRQAVAFAVSDIAIELDGMRLLTWRAASRADQGKPFDREVALARRLCAAKGVQIGSQGVQLLGGHGYVKEHPVERWYRDLRATGLMEGGLLV
jgi:alkylation response protein AidB-like acyl-CoA dehydrogenase